ncbi:hypothetical protein ACWXWE_03885 [Pantoea ananatis]
MFSSFIKPYVLFCYSATYSILQILDGTGLTSTISYGTSLQSPFATLIFSADEQARGLLPMIIISMIIIVCIFIMAAFVYGHFKGMALCIFLLLLPGILSISGHFPDIRWLPFYYSLGGGDEVGSPTGISCLIISGMILGWAIFILVQYAINAGEKFRTILDIMLILTASANGIFWVHDKEVGGINSLYQETSADMNKASSYLLKQVEYYDEQCSSGLVKSKSSCHWASEIQSHLKDYAYASPEYLIRFTPSSIIDFYKPYDMPESEVDEIRNEISKFNEITCPVIKLGQGVSKMASSSRLCQETPQQFCNAIIENRFMEVASGEVAVASECIFSSMLRNKKILTKQKSELNESSHSNNFRWLWFILLSIFLGGKVAALMYKIKK